MIRNDHTSFPVDAIEHEMRVRGKSLTFTDEEIQDLADRKYGSRDPFGLLTLLFPFVDTRNQFHIDHVFTRAMFHANKLKALGFTAEDVARLGEMKERLPNLQLLQGPDYQSKNDQMPAGWITDTYKKKTERDDYIARHLLDGVMTDMKGFETFFQQGRDNLLERIRVVMNEPAGAVTGGSENRPQAARPGELTMLPLLSSADAGTDLRWEFHDQHFNLHRL